MAVLIQAGHVNIENNDDWGLRGQTGAPGEREFTARVAGIVAGALRANGVDCVVADANANNDGQVTGRDWDAAVALHCDARSRSGYAVGVGNPAEDGAAAESFRLKQCLELAYGRVTGLADVNDLGENPNVTEYYLFNSLSEATPFVLIEMGAISDPTGGHGPDDLFLTSHTDKAADGIVEGVLDFLNVDAKADTQGPPPSPPSYPGIPEVDAPVLVGPPPALVPSTERNLPDAITNISQAREYARELLNVAREDEPMSNSAGNEVAHLVDQIPTLVAIMNELNLALGYLGAQ